MPLTTELPGTEFVMARRSSPVRLELINPAFPGADCNDGTPGSMKGSIAGRFKLLMEG